ncbi:MAG: hypothetical protein LBT39_04410, partial [Treponema sp.]|nr:hypothetical protein [Treponema sp.]
MGNKAVRLLFLALVLFPTISLVAQEKYSPADDPTLTQRLSWYADENAIQYEVVIEKAQEQENYQEV